MSPRNSGRFNRVKKPCPCHAKIEGAGPMDLWTTKEGFTVQIKSMSDLHLMHAFMMVVETARKRLGALHAESLVDASVARNPLEWSARNNTRHFEPMFNELRHRKILNRMPSSF